MKTKSILAGLLLPVLSLAAVLASSAPEEKVAEEIDHLFSYLESSDCEFYRNGDWYDSERAVSHLQRKYNWLEKRDLLPSTEAFIERAASESSFSGEPYKVRCPGEGERYSEDWMHAALEKFRQG